MMRLVFAPVPRFVIALIALVLAAGIAWAPNTTRLTIHPQSANATGVEDGALDHPYDTIHEAIDATADDHTISASYSDSTTSAPTCTLTLDCATEVWEFKINGTTRPCGWSGMFNCGEVVELEATPLVDCVRLCRWEVNGVAIGANPIFITMDSDKVAVPVFGASYPVMCTVAAFPDAPNCGDLVAVDATVTTDYCGNPLTCTIDWADGSASDCSENTHTYRAPGLYEVTATFTDELWGHTAGVCGTTVTVSAHTIHVDCTNTTGIEDGTPEHPFDTIQEGIDAAVDGDTVLVRPCTYYENINFLGKAITVTSTDPLDPVVVDATVIDGGGAGSVVTIAGCGAVPPVVNAGSVIEGFTITNGSAEAGGGILCSGCPTIRYNRIIGSNASRGGGVFCASTEYPASLAIANNIIAGNAADQGAGVYCADCATPAITSNTIADNTASDGAGICCFTMIWCMPLPGVALTISNNIVAFNSSGVYRGGTYPWPSLRNNCVYNPDGYDYSGLDPGEGDISVDPLFLDPDAGDYHLTAGSPCIDAGWNDAPGVPDADMDGDSRPWLPGGTVDIGADEWVPGCPWFQLPGGCWHLITIPCSPAESDPWQVFDELRPPSKPADLLSRCLYRWDEATQGYLAYERSAPDVFGPLASGAGYWLWVDENETISYEAQCSITPEVASFANAGWHIIGSPHPGDTHIADTGWYRAANGPYPFRDIMNFWLQDPLVGYRHDLRRYYSVGLLPTDEDHHLRAFRGYWLYTFVEDVTLEIPSR